MSAGYYLMHIDHKMLEAKVQRKDLWSNGSDLKYQVLPRGFLFQETEGQRDDSDRTGPKVRKVNRGGNLRGQRLIEPAEEQQPI